MENVQAREYFGYPITIRRLCEGYSFNSETGEIRCFGGKLNPRPSYQREFVYSLKDQEKLFSTLYKNFPIGMFYWCGVEGDANAFELVDGQQRTISIINIINDDVPIEICGQRKYFSDLPEINRERILNYELTVYICLGNLEQKLDWFSTINIAGKALTPQELRSAIYSGPFISDARKYFVTSADATALSNHYSYFVKASTFRQELLEKVLDWHSDAEGFKGKLDERICAYLRQHRNDADASKLWKYYQEVLTWAENLFGLTYKKELSKVNWGVLFNLYHTIYYSPADVQAEVADLMANPEIERKSGIFEYVFSREEKVLSPRVFDESLKRSKFEEQHHKCAYCGKEITDLRSAAADHIIPWSKGGKTDYSNLQILCVKCNSRKYNKSEAE